MNLIIVLLILLLAAVIAIYIVRQLPLDPSIKNIALLIVGIIFLVALIAVILPLVGINVGPITSP